MLINLSNHPFEKWDNAQKEAAILAFGIVVDLPFPEVDPMMDTAKVDELATDYLLQCVAKLGVSKDKTNAVHISGEPCFLFRFVTLAKSHGIPCVCSTTRRLVTNEGNIKTSIFQFVQFRKYFKPKKSLKTISSRAKKIYQSFILHLKPKKSLKTMSSRAKKICQFLILLIILTIEFIGFSHHFHLWHAHFSILIKTAITLLQAISIYLLYSKLKKDKKNPLFIVILIKGFQSKGSDFIGIFNIVFMLCSIAWIGLEFYGHTLSGLFNAFIYFGFLILYPLFIITLFFSQNSANTKEYHPKILITALSKPNETLLKKNIEEMNKNYKDQWAEQAIHEKDGSLKISNNIPWGPWFNWDPIRKSIIEHKASFHEIIIILSNEVANDINKFPDDLNPEKLISDFIEVVYPNLTHKVKIDLRRVGVSGNDLHENEVAIDGIIQLIKHRKNDERDILFNITGGTVAISGAMILKAIPGERKAEYANQDTGLIDAVPLNIYQVKDLWAELIENVG
jgi:hypothetical protein